GFRRCSIRDTLACDLPCGRFRAGQLTRERRPAVIEPIERTTAAAARCFLVSKLTSPARDDQTHGPHPGSRASTASRRMARGTASLVAVLRDARKERAPQDEVLRRRGRDFPMWARCLVSCGLALVSMTVLGLAQSPSPNGVKTLNPPGAIKVEGTWSLGAR